MATARVTRPNKVKVGPWTYTIKWMNDKEWLDDGHNDNWGGESDHEGTTIYMRITERRGEGSLKETLLHEIQHCVWTVVALNHFPKPPKGDDIDEYVIASTTPVLYAALLDNPHVVKYLMSP